MQLVVRPGMYVSEKRKLKVQRNSRHELRDRLEMEQVQAFLAQTLDVNALRYELRLTFV